MQLLVCPSQPRVIEYVLLPPLPSQHTICNISGCSLFLGFVHRQHVLVSHLIIIVLKLRLKIQSKYPTCYIDGVLETCLHLAAAYQSVQRRSLLRAESSLPRCFRAQPAGARWSVTLALGAPEHSNDATGKDFRTQH